MSLPILLFYGFSFIGIVHALLFSFLAIKNKNIPNLILSLFLLAQSLIILEYVFFWTGLYLVHPYLCNISLPLLLSFGPLLLMYVDFAFFEPKKVLVYVMHFLPAILVFTLMLPYFFSSTDAKLNHSKDIPFFVVNLLGVAYFIIVHMACYFIYLVLKIRSEKRVAYLKKWMLLILSLFGFYIVCYLAYYILIRFPWFNLTTDYFVSLGMCASIVALIYFAFARNAIFEGKRIPEAIQLKNIYFQYHSTVKDIKQDILKDSPTIYEYTTSAPKSNTTPINLIEVEKNPLKYKNSGLTEQTVAELARALEHLMKTEKLYAESELKLETLAAKLGIAKHALSQVINQSFEVSFFEYINLHRIHEAKKLLANKEKAHLTIIEIAYEVGYNTKNTFNSAFLRIVGMTPSEYRAQQKQEK